jgi:hypothetical protein
MGKGQPRFSEAARLMRAVTSEFIYTNRSPSVELDKSLGVRRTQGKTGLGEADELTGYSSDGESADDTGAWQGRSYVPIANPWYSWLGLRISGHGIVHDHHNKAVAYLSEGDIDVCRGLRVGRWGRVFDEGESFSNYGARY